MGSKTLKAPPNSSTFQYPKLQIRTVKELMEGKAIERSSTVAVIDDTFKKAPKAKTKSSGEQTALDLMAPVHNGALDHGPAG